MAVSGHVKHTTATTSYATKRYESNMLFLKRETVCCERIDFPGYGCIQWFPTASLLILFHKVKTRSDHPEPGGGETTALKIAVGTGCFRMERGSEGGKRHLECGRLTSPFKSLVKETWALKNWKKEALIRNHYLQSWLIIILGLWQSHRWELKGERAVAFGLGVANLRVSETG